MCDAELKSDVMRQIDEACDKIISRFGMIKEIVDFTDSPAGMEKMDSICMQLIVAGESIKNLDKITRGEFLSRYTEVDWRKAKGMRDIITHHYAEINAETIFYTCQNNIPLLSKIIKKMINELEDK
jgi:uncharacterized protein with HEPN domain